MYVCRWLFCALFGNYCVHALKISILEITMGRLILGEAMLKNRSYFLFSIISFVVCTSLAHPPVNLTVAKQEVEKYYECGEYDADMRRIINEAIRHFSHVRNPQTKTVVFDIDDTMFSLYCEEQAISYGHIPAYSHAHALQANLPIILETKRLYDFLINRGFHVIFLTGRTLDESTATEKNLRRNGINTFDKIIMRTPAEQGLTAQEFKSMHRKQLAQEGYQIAGSVGDQWSDLLGGNAGYQVKLPNYRYILD